MFDEMPMRRKTLRERESYLEEEENGEAEKSQQGNAIRANEPWSGRVMMSCGVVSWESHWRRRIRRTKRVFFFVMPPTIIVSRLSSFISLSLSLYFPSLHLLQVIFWTIFHESWVFSQFYLWFNLQFSYRTTKKKPSNFPFFSFPFILNFELTLRPKD